MQDRAEKRRYHFIYKTVNIITNKFYIGMHSTNNLEDGYIGSGKRLWYSIKKYGKENHKCEILEFLDNRKSLANREAEIINEEFLLNPLCLNIALGGSGGFENIDPLIMKEGRRKGALVQVKTFQTPERIAKRVQTRKERSGFATFTGRKHSVESKDKISKSMLNKQDGNKNSQFGTCWIWHELIGNKKISFNCLPEFIEQGWQKGRKYRNTVL